MDLDEIGVRHLAERDATVMVSPVQLSDRDVDLIKKRSLSKKNEGDPEDFYVQTTEKDRIDNAPVHSPEELDTMSRDIMRMNDNKKNDYTLDKIDRSDWFKVSERSYRPVGASDLHSTRTSEIVTITSDITPCLGS
jgi:hypothetical protein